MTPEQPPVDEIGEKLKEKLWKDQIKAFLNFRSFLRQRPLLQKYPAGDFPAEAVATPDWRTPLAFALQATLLIGVIAGVISTGFDAAVEPRPVTVLEVVASETGVKFHPRQVAGGATWDTRKSILEKHRETTAAQLEYIRSSASTDSFTPPIPSSEADTVSSVSPNLIERWRESWNR